MDPEARGCVCVFHYLDYFLLVGSPSSNQCEEHLKILLKTFDRLNIPVALEKLEGPTTVLTFLGIEMDTQNSTLRLPRDKVQELKSLIATWSQRKSCTKRDLQSLVGKLQHACKVVCLGRSFLRRMFELLRGTAKKQHLHPTQSIIPLRLEVVASIPGVLEWSCNDGITGMAAQDPSLCRRIGLLWLWSMVGPIMATGSMDKRRTRVVHCSKRTLANCVSSNAMGKGLEGQGSIGPL